MSGNIQPAKPSTLKRYFVGFSTQNALTTGVRTYYDIDLINIDLMTAFNTRVGERVMRPEYGCKLWDYVMEPMTAMTSDLIIQEATRICELDTRLKVQTVNVYQADQGFTIAITLQYLPWMVVSTFTATFESENSVYYGTSLSSGGTSLA